MARYRIALLILLSVAFLWTGPQTQRADSNLTNSNAKRKVLYLTHSAGFKHSVLPLSEQIMKEIADKSGAFAVTVTQDCSLINKETLKDYHAVFFYTTGELPISDEQKADLMNFIKSGKGFVGAHSASDTFYKWPEYGEMIGGYFDGHPWHQDVVIKVEDPKHPAVQHLEPSFKIKDEIYQFKEFSRDRVRVLLSLDNSSVDVNKQGVKRADKDFALAWCRSYGKGRVFYTALGHRDEVWQDERFQKHLLNGIRWAMGEIEGEATPISRKQAD